MDTTDYPNLIRHEGEALLSAVTGNLDRPVPTCPGWDARRLVGHVGRVLEAQTTHIRRATTQPPERVGPPPTDDTELIDYYHQCLDLAVDILTSVDADLPAWNFTLAPKIARFWPRRLAHELLVHRYDAANCAGLTWTVEPTFAADGVDEVLTVLLPAARAAGVTPVAADGSAHVHLTDTDGEWLVRLDGTTVEVSVGHAKGDGMLRGPADKVLLALWGRVAPDSDGLIVLGSAELIQALLPGR
ncbi:maleylpyruvate isomerase family mycothiol-dependent enzyme [Frankia sp. Cr2]|uniref:maleylpyruvate isomerase family mycothiol-dependent enzyme n=1 Tax=Frankia sp. Cr2 TaxID=3073932 RepID=UPI002AD3B0A5|nr:maleylpyruvate isomerase family mycothiol-dependent enzyme [Frankia sp. Cr2]